MAPWPFGDETAREQTKHAGDDEYRRQHAEPSSRAMSVREHADDPGGERIAEKWMATTFAATARARIAGVAAPRMTAFSGPTLRNSRTSAIAVELQNTTG
jgi:hypothetical protein